MLQNCQDNDKQGNSSLEGPKFVTVTDPIL